MNNMVVTLTLLFLAFAPQTTALTTEWLLTWDQMGTQYIRVSVTQEGAALKATWENESFQCTLTGNVCEGTVTENSNPKAGKVKITIKMARSRGKAPNSKARSHSSETLRPRRLLAVQRTHKFEPTAFHNYFAWNIAPALAYFPGDTVETKSVDAGVSMKTASAVHAAATP